VYDLYYKSSARRERDHCINCSTRKRRGKKRRIKKNCRLYENRISSFQRLNTHTYESTYTLSRIILSLYHTFKYPICLDAIKITFTLCTRPRRTRRQCIYTCVCVHPRSPCAFGFLFFQFLFLSGRFALLISRDNRFFYARDFLVRRLWYVRTRIVYATGVAFIPTTKDWRTR